MKNLKSALLILAGGMVLSSCSNKLTTQKGEYDDMYGSSADAPQFESLYAEAPKTYKSSIPESAISTYDDSYDRSNQAAAQPTDEYYSEEYLSTRDVKRKSSPNPGYYDGYSDGYSQGWTDQSWSRPMGWNSPFNQFGGGFNSFSNSFFGPSIAIGFGFNNFNRFGSGWGYNNFYSPWGYNNFNSPWGFNSMAFNNFYSPWGYNNFYSPWGYNSFYSPWGYNDFYSPYNNFYGGNRYNSFYGNNNSAVARSNAYETGSRTYGARDARSSNNTYNDRFVNTSRPVASQSSARGNFERNQSSGVNSGTSNDTRALADRKSGTWVRDNGVSSDNNRSQSYSKSYSSEGSNAYNPNSRTTSSYESYRSNNNSSSYNSRSSNGNSGFESSSNSTRSYSPSNTYNREAPSSNSNSSRGGWYNNNSNNSNSRSSSDWGGSSRGSSSPSSSGSSSSGSSSRGSSGSSSSSGGSSRGPR